MTTRRILISAAILTLCASVAVAQLPVRTVSGLPTALCTSGELEDHLFAVSDGDSAGDCSTGGGSTLVICACDGGTLRAANSPDLSAYALLAGDADGQTIQGRTGANAARVDIGEGTAQQVRLIGSGATPGYLYAYDNGVFASSPDEASSWDVYDGGMEFNTDGDLSLGGTNSAQLSSVGIVALNGGAGIRVTTGQTPPTNANDTCTAGDFIPTTGFIYFCVSTDTWQRVAIATWP